jgi:hypothetical protein
MRSLLQKIINKSFFIYLVSIFLIVLLIFLTFDGIKSLYFLQDEWLGFGRLQYLGIKKVWIPDGGNHILPLSSIFFYLENKIFGLNQIGYIYTALFLHTLASLGIYTVFRKIFKNNLVGLSAALIFASSFISHQTVSWFGVAHTTILSTIFALISIYSFSRYLSLPKNKTKYLNYCFLALFVSLLSKEDTITLFLFYPLASYIYNKKFMPDVLKRSVVFGIIYLVLRFEFMGSIDPSVHVVGMVRLISIIKNVITFPLVGFSQLFFPNNTIAGMNGWLQRTITWSGLSGVPDGDLTNFFVTTNFNWVSIALSLCLIIFAIAYLFMSKNGNKKKVIQILLLFCLLSFFPYTLIYASEGLESRHFYFPMVGGSVSIACVIYLYSKHFKNLILRFVLLVAFLVYIVNNINLVRNYTKKLAELSYPRIKAVSEIQSLYRNVSKKSIFFITADIPFFLPTNPLPFQQGNGYTMMVLFSNMNNYSELLKRNFLWDLGSQGYYEEGDTGFGFFADEKMFIESFEKSDLKYENIFAGFWVSKEMRLDDRTNEYRKLFEANNYK